MTSTFFGLETAKRALSTQQSALYVTGHNISNANTPGYTRQRVNMTTTTPYPSPSINRPQIPGQLGTGVSTGDITRVRDSFTDMQYRTETSKLGYWQSKATMMSQMEDIMNEPSETGLASTLDEFWNAMQDLAVQPQNDGARRVARERGISLANTFNYLSNSLKSIQTDYRKEIDTTQDAVNSLLRQINSVNKQIGSVEPHGYLPNDLYDERDRLVDELSTYMNIKVEAKPSGGLASASAEGKLDIYMATPEGNVLKDSDGRPIKLVDSSMGKATGIHIQYESRTEMDSPVEQIKFFQLNDTEEGFAGISNQIMADESSNTQYILNDFSAFKSNGALKGYIEGYGYTDNSGNLKGTYNDMLADLDQMAYTFATHFNTVHNAGWSLNEIESGTQNSEYGSFFAIGDSVKGAASQIAVSQHIIEDVQNIAAAAEGNVLAGTLKRGSNVDDATVGNPTYTGIFDVSSINDPAVRSAWENAADIKVTVSADKTGTTTSWSYRVEALDTDGNIMTASPTPVTGSFTGTDVKIFGVTLDLSNVSKLTDGTSTWDITFSPEGAKLIDEAFKGNGSNALALANVKDAILNYGGTLTNVHSFYQGMIGKLGDNASEANRMTVTAATLMDSVGQRRMSESSVSLDEEMVNMIQYQHAYNAAARQITLLDEMLDKIINGMGVVGR